MCYLIRFVQLSLLFFCLITAINAQPSLNTNAVVLSYEDFGPQIVAYKLIGNEWYQWHSHGSSDPKVRDDIRVVVYRHTYLSKIKRLYPVIKDRRDYRYVEYDKAVKFIDARIKEWQKELMLEKDDAVRETLNRLLLQYQNTRAKIVTALEKS